MQYRIDKSCLSKHSALLAVVAAVFFIAPGNRAVAQDGPNWDILRTRQSLAPSDEEVLKKWLTSELQTVLTQRTSANARQQGKRLFDELKEQYDAVNAQKGFQAALAKLLADTFLAEYKPAANGANAGHPLGRLYVMLALTDFGQPSASKVYTTVLAEDPSSGSRERAATGLLRLKAKMNPDELTQVRELMTKVGQTETNGLVLSRIYAFLTETNANQVAVTLPMVTAILDARFERFEQKWSVPRYADAEAAIWLADRHQSANAAQKATIIKTLARLMADATMIRAHQALSASNRWGVEYVVAISEGYLRMLTSVDGPDVAGIIANSKKDEDPETLKAALIAELAKWIGNEAKATEGALNRAPHNLPVELGIKRPAPPNGKKTAVTE